VADDVEGDWKSEPIPENSLLFMRVHRAYIDEKGAPTPGAFRNLPTPESGMSTDWCKYSSAEETRQRARSPAENGVIALPVESVRQIPGQTVEHTPQQRPPEPLKPNRAHTDIWGPKSPEVRVKLLGIYTWAIHRED
jgi:hypothetical protein